MNGFIGDKDTTTLMPLVFKNLIVKKAMFDLQFSNSI